MATDANGGPHRLSPNAEFLFSAVFKTMTSAEVARRYYAVLRQRAETKKACRGRTFTKEEVEEVIAHCERKFASAAPAQSGQASGKGGAHDAWWPRWVLDAAKGVEVLVPSGPGKPSTWAHATGLGIGYHGQKKRYLFVRSPKFEMDCRKHEVRMPGGGKTVDTLMQELLARGEDPSCHPEWTDGSDVKPSDPKKSVELFVTPGVAPDAARGSAHADQPRRSESCVDLLEELEGDFERMALLRRSSVVKIKTSDHPDPLTEPRTAASIKMPALTSEDVLGLPQAVAESKLSSLQLETVCYAARRFRTTLPDGRTAGYLLGDGTGCGKGRCIAALIYHMWNLGHRRSIWVSATSDLYYDAVRDLQDLGADIPCMTMRKLPPSGPLDRRGSEAHKELVKNLGVEGNGVIFLTYSLLVQTGQRRQVYACPVRTEENRNLLLSEILDERLRCAKKVEDFGDEKGTVNLHPGDRIVSHKKLQDLMAMALPFTVTFERVLSTKGKGKGSAAPEAQEKEGKEGESSEYTPWNSRLGQLVSWLGGSEATGLICFDEVHKAKNLVPDKDEAASTKTGLFVDLLQNECPKAPVLYVSATAATEVQHLGYMSRLGAWGPGSAFENFYDFMKAIESNGVAAMEMFAINMKALGALSCRALGYVGTQFDTQVNGLTQEQTEQYNDSSAFWLRLVGAYKKFAESKDLAEAYKLKWHFKKKDNKDVELGQRLWQAFWGSQQRFFKAMCNSFKVPAAAAVAREAVKQGEQVVISIWATGEARSKRALEKLKEDTPGRVTIQSVKEGGLVRVRVEDAGILEKISAHLFANMRLKSDVTISGARVEKSSLLHTVHGQRLSRPEDLAGAVVPAELVFRSQVSKHLVVEAKLQRSGGELVKFELCDDALGERVIVGKVIEGPASFRRAELERWHVKTINNRPVGKLRVQAIRSRLKPGQHLAFQDPVIPEHLSGPQMILEHFLNSQFLTQTEKGVDVPWAGELKEQLLQEAKKLQLPPNAMDELVDQLGGSRKVAELSGRSHRMKRLRNGNLAYVARADELKCPLLGVNMVEQVLFQRGSKQVCLVTEVASAGISLHSDRRQVRKDFQPPRRTLISLELPWGADKAIQVFGRVHRANQLVPPKFVMLCTPLGGEVRFISSIARRMKLMGAVTKGDRMTCMGGQADKQMSDYDVNNIYGVKALASFYKDTTTAQGASSELLGLYKALPFIGAEREGEATGRWNCWEDFRATMKEVWYSTQLTKELIELLDNFNENIARGQLRVSPAITRFLNRLLMLDVELQNAAFEAFFAIYSELVRVDKANGAYDDGIQNLNMHQGRKIKEVKADFREVLYTDPASGSETCHVRLSLDKGITWEAAKEEYDSLSGKDPVEGFYRYRAYPGAECVYHLVREREQLGGASSSGSSWVNRRRYKQYLVWRPDEGVRTGQEWGRLAFAKEDFSEDDRYEKLEGSPADMEEAQRGWTAVYAESAERRLSHVHILTGDVLTAWRLVHGNSPKSMQGDAVLQIVRAVTQPDNLPVVGMQVPEESLASLRYVLECQQEETKRELDEKKGSGPDMRSVALTAASILMKQLKESDERSLPCPTWLEVHKHLSEDPRIPRSVVGLRGTQVAMTRLEKKGMIIFEGGRVGLKFNKDGSDPDAVAEDPEDLEMKMFPEEFEFKQANDLSDDDDDASENLDDTLENDMEELLEQDGLFDGMEDDGQPSGEAAGASEPSRPKKRKGADGVASAPTPIKAWKAHDTAAHAPDELETEPKKKNKRKKEKKDKKDKKEKKAKKAKVDNADDGGEDREKPDEEEDAALEAELFGDCDSADESAPQDAKNARPPAEAAVAGGGGAASEPRSETGMIWAFEVTGKKIAIRTSPDVGSAEQGEHLQTGELFCAVEKLHQADGRVYLRLQDGRGWGYDKSAKDLNKVVVQQVAEEAA